MHISEIAHEHIGTPGEKLEPGQQVNVKILGIDEEKDVSHFQLKLHYLKKTLLSDDATTQSYLSNDSNEDNPTLGDVFGDKFKDLKF